MRHCGQLLKLLRERRGVSLDELSRKTGVRCEALKSFERGWIRFGEQSEGPLIHLLSLEQLAFITRAYVRALDLNFMCEVEPYFWWFRVSGKDGSLVLSARIELSSGSVRAIERARRRTAGSAPPVRRASVKRLSFPSLEQPTRRA